jgi:hypothetical protein
MNYKYQKQVLHRIVWTIIIFLPFLCLSGLGSWRYLFLFSDERKITDGLALMVCIVFFVLFLYTFILNILDRLTARIVPYFKERTQESDTFFKGQTIAKNCRKLDEIAMKINICPISEFGFNDDLDGEQVKWHDPKKGLETISGLLNQIRQNPTLVKEASSVISDLGRVEIALKNAASKSIPFCFLLREGSEYYDVSQAEKNRRKGSFS